MPPFLDLLEIVNRLTQSRQPPQPRNVHDAIIHGGNIWPNRPASLTNYQPFPQPRYRPRSPWDVLAHATGRPPGIDAARRRDINSIFQPTRPVSSPEWDKYDVVPHNWIVRDF